MALIPNSNQIFYDGNIGNVLAWYAQEEKNVTIKTSTRKTIALIIL